MNEILRFLDRQRIIQPAVNGQIGFDFQGLIRSYGDDPTHPDARLVARFGRMWIYDVALSIYADLKVNRFRQAGHQAGRLMQLARREKEQGFNGAWHFSYNTLGDLFIDPRGPAGANAWCTNAIYAYLLSTKEASLLSWANNLVREFFFKQQVTDSSDGRWGLLRAGLYNAQDAARGDAMGYRVYEGDVNYPYQHVILEHNADFAGTLRLAFQATQLFSPAERSFLEELIHRHDILMQGMKRSFWQKDHFVSAMDGQGRLYTGTDGTPSIAVDNNTWAAHVFLPYDLEIPRAAARYVEEHFLTRTPPAHLEDLPAGASPQELEGLYYFPATFVDPFVAIPAEHRAKMNQLLHPEAAFGFVLFIHDLAKRLSPSEGQPLQRRARRLYEDTIALQRLYGPSGAPYASANVPSIFSTLPSVTTAATSLITTAILQGAPHDDFIGVRPPAEFTVEGQPPKTVPGTER